MTTTVTRAMLSDAAARRTGLSRADTAAVGEAMFALIAEALMAGENVKLTAFGTLQLRDRAERIGRNPRTGTEHRIAPRQTVVFTPSAQLRQALGQLADESASQIRESA
ncbi:integration host factor subunit alpha [Devosia sp. A449]